MTVEAGIPLFCRNLAVPAAFLSGPPGLPLATVCSTPDDHKTDDALRPFRSLRVARTSFYLPDADDSAAAFMIEGRKADEAAVGCDPMQMQCIGLVPTTWTLIKRPSDTGGGIPGAADIVAAGVRLRCQAGRRCRRGASGSCWRR